MTLNPWGCRGDWSECRRVLVTGIRELAPDLVAFQESIEDETHDQAADLLGPDYH
jgi:hypothetical protein